MALSLRASSTSFIKRDSKISRRGRLFVIVGGKTFSAAVGLTSELMRHLPVIPVGEPMGAPLNSSGDAGHALLPNHKIDVAVSTKYWQGGHSDARLIAVQLPASMTGALYFAGRDPAIETILARPAPYPEVVTTLQQHGGAAARTLWTDLRDKYGAIPWWQAFSRLPNTER